MQDTYMRAWEAFVSLVDEAQVRGWLVRILQRVTSDHYRTHLRRQTLLPVTRLDDEHSEILASHQEGPLEALISRCSDERVEFDAAETSPGVYGGPGAHSGAFVGSADWLAVRFSPAERGSDPFFSFARALPLKQRTASESLEAIAKTLFEDPTELNRLADQLLQGKPPHAKLLLFADQFE
ncbi:MAG: RNA polymerase sigma factor [Gammaproteobacteria bacterium]